MIETRDEFVARRHADWEELDGILAGSKAVHRLPGPAISRAASLYRAVCTDLMRARGAGFEPELVAYLDGLAGRGHNAFYTAPPYRFRAAFELLAEGFPRALRRHAAFLTFAAFLFLAPAVFGFVGAYSSRAFVNSVVSAETAEEMEEMYAEGFGKGRATGEDTAMAGFYVYNNVGIAFRCFATGIFFGLGSIFFLVYNGLLIGAVFGVVFRAGHGLHILTFCCGHSTFELTAIVIAGTAGMVMGYSLVETNGRTRIGSLRARARDVAALILGAGAMLLVAAGIEGFWSPSSVPAPVKWVVAVALSGVVAAWLALAGRKPLEERG